MCRAFGEFSGSVRHERPEGDRAAFFERYQQFAEKAGERWTASKDLPAEMARRGFEHKRGTGGQRLYLGIEFRHSEAAW